jgi:secreted PhoX family phosphatase
MKMNHAKQSNLSARQLSTKSMSEIIELRLSRRATLKALTAGLLTAGFAPVARLARAAAPESGSTLKFAEISAAIRPTHAVAPGYSANIVIRWGDKVVGDAPEFEPQRQSQFAQERQFGYNNDFVGYFPLPAGSSNSEHGLLCVNHEYTNSHLMFPGAPRETAVTREPKIALTIGASPRIRRG